jgi:ATP-dependent RNA helicase DDX35
MPTIIEKGKIKLPKGTDQNEVKRANNMRAIEYVMEQLGKKLNLVANSMNKNITHWSDKVLILEAFTGSGKTTSVAPAIFKSYFDKLNRNIINTLPLIASVINTVKEVSAIFKMEVGETLGFQTGSVAKKPVKGVIYATIGILLQQIKVMTAEQFMQQYAVIIIDEAHQRSLDVDLTIFLLKKFILEHWENPLCPHIIFMSATLDVAKFSSYFGEKNKRPQVITVEGMSHPIDTYFLEHPAEDFIQKAIEIALKIHKENEVDFDHPKQWGDILIFVSGKADTKTIIEALIEANKTLEHKVYPAELSSTVLSKGGKDALTKDLPLHSLRIDGKIPKRKIIISTPAAETSITIDSLRYVIDTGFRNDTSTYPSGFRTIVQKPITQDMAKQRRGRVGRVSTGVWYPVYTEEDFNALQYTSFPEIIIKDISTMLLSIIAKEGKFDIESLDMMDKPPGDNIHTALEKLYAMHAIYPDTSPTEVGLCINRFRKLRLESAAMILAGYHYGANIFDLVTIVAMLETSELLGRKYKRREILAPEYMDYFVADSFIDLLFLFHEFTQYSTNVRKATQFCIDNKIKYEKMLTVIEIRDTIIEDMVLMVGFSPLYNGLGVKPVDYNLAKMLKKVPDIAIDEIIKIKKCIYSGFMTNLAILVEEQGKAPYYRSRYGKKINKAPPGMPRFFIYDDLTLRDNKGKMQYGYEFYSVIDNFFDIDITLL